MKLKKVIILTLILLCSIALIFGCTKSKDSKEEKVTTNKTEATKGDGELFAVFNTSLGKIVVKLFPDKAPETVANFVGLAEGTKEYTDPKSKEKVTGKYYDGTIFHRIISDFMIQGGDILGNGTGGPGYTFKDEFDSGLTFNKPGLLAMANRGPNTNGAQFFITEVPTPHLNNRHTIFGEVIEGFDVIKAMVAVKRGPGDKPVEDIVLNSLEIVR